MKTQIVIHLLPHELDWFDWQSKQMKIGSNFLEPSDEIILDVTLNLNLVDWESSKIPKEFFIEKFNNILLLWDWCKIIANTDSDNKCRGCDDKRRNSIRESVSDNILYLDSDLIFRPENLKYIITAAKEIPSQYYIISSEIVKIWDNSWDCITNKNYINHIPDLDKYYNSDPFKIIVDGMGESVGLKSIDIFKFGGGWFNLLSTNLLKLTDIPDSFGPYGVDDSYVMICCGILKNKKYDIKQYVLENMIVTENYKYRQNPYKNYLTIINKQTEFRKTAESNLNKEIQEFIKRL
jgi:hypothetical protein